MSRRARAFGRKPLSLAGLALAAGLAALPRPASRAASAPDPEPSTPRTRTARAHRLKSADNLKQIAQGMIRFAGDHLSFPAAAIVDRKGKALLSWRVAILPYLGEEKLHGQFKLDEPWDSKHNKKLLARMPRVYAPPVAGKPAKRNATYYQVFTGPDTPFDPRAVGGVPPLGLGPRFPASFPDGISDSILVVEAKDPVPWTKPADVECGAKNLPRLGGLFKDGFHVAMADGSVLFMARKVEEWTLRALITPNGGEVIERDKVPWGRAPAGKKK